MTARDAGRAAAQALLRTDPLSEDSINLIADRVMDAYAPGHRAEVLAEAPSAALREAAEWIVRAGYPVDWGTAEHPPPALWEALVDAVHADPTGSLHGHELSREEVDAWLRHETGRPAGRQPQDARRTRTSAMRSCATTSS